MGDAVELESRLAEAVVERAREALANDLDAAISLEAEALEEAIKKALGEFGEIKISIPGEVLEEMVRKTINFRARQSDEKMEKLLKAQGEALKKSSAEALNKGLTSAIASLSREIREGDAAVEAQISLRSVNITERLERIEARLSQMTGDLGDLKKAGETGHKEMTAEITPPSNDGGTMSQAATPMAPIAAPAPTPTPIFSQADLRALAEAIAKAARPSTIEVARDWATLFFSAAAAVAAGYQLFNSPTGKR